MGIFNRLFNRPQTTSRYPIDIIEPLKKTWPEWRRYDMDVPPLPNDHSLGQLLDTIYHASFTMEERRKTQFSAVMCNPDKTRQPTVFSEPREFSVHELRRLAPVAMSGQALIGINWPSAFGPPSIWGLCGSAWSQLKISAISPGTLEVGRDEKVFLTLRGGQLIPENFKSGIFGPVSEFISAVNTELWADLSYEGGWSPQVVVYPGHFMSIFSRIAHSGHGGTVLLVPDTLARESLVPHVRSKYQCDDNQIWPILKTAMRQFSEDTDRHKIESAESELKELVDRVGDLATVDGAVVLTDRLRILGFGAEIISKADVDEISVMPDHRSVEVEAFGTRHRSAFRFCHSLPQCMAVVCSQDGGSRAIRAANNGTIEVYE